MTRFELKNFVISNTHCGARITLLAQLQPLAKLGNQSTFELDHAMTAARFDCRY
jgi:hypothetical protein